MNEPLAVTMVHIYLTEAEGRLAKLLHYLHNENRIRGATVLRGITGFGHSGKIHTSHLLDLALDLPLVVEFFDEPEKIATLLPQLKTLVEPDHIVYWSAHVNN